MALFIKLIAGHVKNVLPILYDGFFRTVPLKVDVPEPDTADSLIYPRVARNQPSVKCAANSAQHVVKYRGSAPQNQ
jgi:hypothetical protein